MRAVTVGVLVTHRTGRTRARQLGVEGRAVVFDPVGVGLRRRLGAGRRQPLVPDREQTRAAVRLEKHLVPEIDAAVDHADDDAVAGVDGGRGSDAGRAVHVVAVDVGDGAVELLLHRRVALDAHDARERGERAELGGRDRSRG